MNIHEIKGEEQARLVRLALYLDTSKSFAFAAALTCASHDVVPHLLKALHLR